MRKLFISLLTIISTTLPALPQSVGIGTSTPNASSALEVQSNNKGVLLPRMTSAQRKAILNPETGLMIYDLDKKTIMIYEGTKWGQLVFKNTEITEPAPNSIADGESLDYFGNAVSINGDYAVAGAFKDDVNGKNNQGSAYVFHRINGSWVQEAQLFANDGAANDLFGSSVSINGNYIVVGAPEDQVGANVEQGSVYVFVRNGTNWTQLHKFVAPDGAANDHFGFSVCINLDQFIVGCPDDDIGANSDQGSATVYLLTGNTWAQETKLTEVGGTANEQYGAAVAISGIFAIVGIPGDALALGSGSARLYTKIVIWNPIQKLTPSQNYEGSFGGAVAIDGTTAAVRQTIQYGGLGGFYVTGKVYVYLRGGFGIWNEQAKIDDPVYTVFHYFGQSLSLSGDLLVIGSANPQENIANDSAHVSIYKRTGTVWEEQITTYNGYPATNGEFGFAVFISGFNVIIGSPHKKNKKGEINFINLE